MTTFTADYGVEFGEHGPANRKGEPGPYVVWAKFERAPDGPAGRKVFTFSTEDDAVAERLRGVQDYGITETSQPAPEPEPAVESVAAEAE